jgi:hypothetical protein
MIGVNHRTVIFASFLILLTGSPLLLQAETLESEDQYTSKTLESPIGQKGTISFVLETDKPYRNGTGEETYTQWLVSLPEVGGVLFQKAQNAVNVFFLWQKGDQLARGIHLEFADFPGPETFYFQFTWDADRGLSEGYMNGMPLRYPGIEFAPWKIDGQATKYSFANRPIRASKVKVKATYTPPEELKNQVPADLMGKNAALLGKHHTEPIDVTSRKGKLLYEVAFKDEGSVKDWIMEGPGIVEFDEGQMNLRSPEPNPQTRQEFHYTFWCPTDFPESFVAEWDFKPLNEHGLSLIFFAALGSDGKDIFDKTIAARDGHYPQYTSGDILNYHVIYYSHLPFYQTGNIFTRLRKANQFLHVAEGQIAVKPGTKDFKTLRLIKDGAHIQLVVDGIVCLDFTDPGTERWGEVLGKGKIGLRQMAQGFGAYRHLRVWSLN